MANLVDYLLMHRRRLYLSSWPILPHHFAQSSYCNRKWIGPQTDKDLHAGSLEVPVLNQLYDVISLYILLYIPKILRDFYISNNRLLYQVLCTAHFHAAVWIISGSNWVLMIHLTDSLLPSITHCSIECRDIQAGITNKLATLLLHLGYQWLLISTLRFLMGVITYPCWD